VFAVAVAGFFAVAAGTAGACAYAVAVSSRTIVGMRVRLFIKMGVACKKWVELENRSN